MSEATAHNRAFDLDPLRAPSSKRSAGPAGLGGAPPPGGTCSFTKLQVGVSRPGSARCWELEAMGTGCVAQRVGKPACRGRNPPPKKKKPAAAETKQL
jgi:hypothetical protein